MTTIPYDPNLQFPGVALQQSFLDKITGALLAGGLIYFYRDVARSTLKDVYYLNPNPSPPDYELVAFPNPLSLSGIGTVEVSNAAKIIYYYPYEADNVTADNYYIVIQDADGGGEFTIEGFPGVGDIVETVNPENNYFVNGQFTIHTTPPGDVTHGAGYIGAALDTTVAAGGWHYIKNQTDGDDFVTFEVIPDSPNTPPAYPRYYCHLKQTVTTTSSRNDLVLRFPNVNTFAGGTYTLVFSAITVSGSVDLTALYYSYYGLNGSSADTHTTPIFPSSTVTNILTTFYATFNFINNSGTTIPGLLGDDYIEIGIRMPSAETWDFKITDVMLILGTTTSAIYPVTTEKQDAWRGYAGGMPVAETQANVTAYQAGKNLYLPIIYKQSGFDFDDSEIGVIYPTPYESVPSGTNYLLCDGTQYLTHGYSSLGIPYSRLQSKLFNTSTNFPKWGVGANFVTTGSLGSNVLLSNANSVGAVTATADGASATGFTFKSISVGQATDYLKASLIASNTIQCVCSNIGLVTAWTAGNTGWAVPVAIRNNASVEAIFNVVAQNTASLTAGHYFIFYTYNGGIQTYYLWFQIDGVGANPAPGGTGVKCNVATGDTAAQVAAKVAATINCFGATQIATTAASAITTGSYFNIYDPAGTHYLVWYKKDGTGTAPVVANTTLVEVDILTADTNAQVATKTQIAMNSMYFAVPDLRGAFIRGWNNSSTNDPNAATRYTNNILSYGDLIGSYELDNNLSHSHQVLTGGGTYDFFTTYPGSNYIQSGGADQIAYSVNDLTTGFSGGAESRPRNIAFNYMIKY